LRRGKNLLKNDKKETDSHPDYKGSLTTPDGTECWVSMWVKRPEGKQPFFSVSVQPKQAPAQTSTPVQVLTPATPIVQGDLPF
jgi:hypothetical protein